MRKARDGREGVDTNLCIVYLWNLWNYYYYCAQRLWAEWVGGLVISLIIV